MNAWKREENSSPKSLPLPLDFLAAFSQDKLEHALTASGKENYSVTPAGRQLDGPMPKEPDIAVRRLAATLVPFADHYPLPFFLVEP